MELGLRNDAGSHAVGDNQDRLINGLKWSYFDQYDPIVPDIHKEEEEEEKPKQDLLVVGVPDEHSETGHHHNHVEDYSDNNRCYLSNNHYKLKRRRRRTLEDVSSQGFTREVPSIILKRKGSKRRRDHEMISDKMRTLHQLLPHCHKTDNISVILDKAIEYMKSLQLQLQMMYSIMGMNSYLPPPPPATLLGFGMHNHYLLAAMAVSHHDLNHASSSPLSPLTNWPLLPPFNSLSSLPQHSQSSSHQGLYSYLPCFPSFLDFTSHMMARLYNM
ncbi:unnamed protein product [Cochlearia groenlandica]